MSVLRRKLSAFGSALARWPVALATVVVLAVALLLPGLGTPGLWEPHERQLADKVAPPAELQKPPVATPASPTETTCHRSAPPDAKARTLGTRALTWGRDVSDSDGGRRLPFALMALLTVLATAGVAMRLAGGRAGVLTALVLLAMPLLVFQARMVIGDIGTACGGALIVYALVALSRIGFRSVVGFPAPPATPAPLLLVGLDAVIAAMALVLGCWLGFHGGGALLGLVVPIGAFAAAGGLGVPALRQPGLARLRGLPAILATLATTGLVALLAYQMYALRDPLDAAGMSARQMFGKAIVADGCWSSLLGGLWRVDDDLRAPFDSMFEQIAYGTFPWGVLAPIAMAGLLYEADRDRRLAGALALAWGGGAWIAGEAFARKAGFNVYAGFPALALAVGVWLDGVLARRGGRDPGGDSAQPGLPAGLMVLGLFVLVAVVDLGKDMHSFPDKVTSLLVGSDQIKYPTQARLLAIPLKTWILLVGAIAALGFALAMIVRRHRAGRAGVPVAIAGTILVSAFLSYVYLPRLSVHLSSKELFETYKELRQDGDQLVIMGDLGHAPRAYAEATPEMVQSRDKIVSALQRPERVFAIAPQTELCTLHRELSGKRYYVVEDRNVRNLLLSNKVDGTTDKNPLATAIVHAPPADIPSRPKGRIVWDRKIELLGWSIPPKATRGKKFQVKLYYKILAPVGGAWKSLMHFDGPLRFNGDHEPIGGRCTTATWQPGDYIIDTHTITAGGGAFPTGRYDLWLGFFTGAAPNWRNMPVSEAPADLRDTADRVKITALELD